MITKADYVIPVIFGKCEYVVQLYLTYELYSEKLDSFVAMDTGGDTPSARLVLFI